MAQPECNLLGKNVLKALPLSSSSRLPVAAFIPADMQHDYQSMQSQSQLSFCKMQRGQLPNCPAKQTEVTCIGVNCPVACSAHQPLSE